MDQPTHCEQLAQQIEAETDEEKKEGLRFLYQAECGGPEPEASTFGDEVPEFDSGGGGNTNPPQPGGPSRPK